MNKEFKRTACRSYCPFDNSNLQAERACHQTHLFKKICSFNKQLWN